MAESGGILRPAVILFSHGSLLCGSGAMLQAHAEHLRRSKKYLVVETGYLNYCTPAIETAIARCAEAGATEVVIVPYFLVAGKFVSRDLPERLRTATADYPHINFHVARALEDAPPLALAIDELLTTATAPSAWQDKAITRAQSVCELRSDCPLYGSPLCRHKSSDAH